MPNIRTQHDYDKWRQKQNRRAIKHARVRARFGPPRTIAKPGVRPLSTMHPNHPSRLYGPADEHSINRDRHIWA